MACFLAAVENGQRIPLDKAVILVGRHQDCDAVLKESRKVSRRHCCIAQVNNEFIIRDLGSMNGVRVNGKRIETESPIHPGDEIAIGDVRFIMQEQEPAGENGSRAEPAAASPSKPESDIPPRKKPKPAKSPAGIMPQPVNLSQNFPVPIDDEPGEDFVVEPSIAISPVFEDLPDLRVSHSEDGEDAAIQDDGSS
ncbi:MAG: FHA domain-containing protein [Planctomycetes bacterium]|nr:FHA domain-containing protein [Planctomycetota bacterium]